MLWVIPIPPVLCTAQSYLYMFIVIVILEREIRYSRYIGSAKMF